MTWVVLQRTSRRNNCCIEIHLLSGQEYIHWKQRTSHRLQAEAPDPHDMHLSAQPICAYSFIIMVTKQSDVYQKRKTDNTRAERAHGARPLLHTTSSVRCGLDDEQQNKVLWHMTPPAELLEDKKTTRHICVGWFAKCVGGGALRVWICWCECWVVLW